MSTPRRRRPSNLSAWACALFLAASCRTENNPEGRWTYGISREAYAEEWSWFGVSGISHPSQLVMIPIVLATPFVLDTVLLPIAVSRDVMYP